MAIAHPSTLLITCSGQIQTDLGQGRVSTTQVLSDSSALPFTSYVSGSIDITASSGFVSLGKYGVGFISSSSIVNIKTIDPTGTSIHDTKLFALNGAVSEFIVSTSSVNPITISFILGSVSPV